MFGNLMTFQTETQLSVMFHSNPHVVKETHPVSISRLGWMLWKFPSC